MSQYLLLAKRLTRAGLAGGAGAFYGSMYMDTQTNYSERREFEDYTTHQTLTESLQTGDVVLFDSNLYTYKLWKSCLSFITKETNQDEYDHVGVIFKPEQDDVPYILEHTYTGTRLMPFEDRVLHSQSTGIKVRRLEECERSEQVLQRVSDWVEAELAASAQKGTQQFRLFQDNLLAIFDSTAACNLSRVDELGVVIAEQQDLQQLAEKIGKNRQISNTEVLRPQLINYRKKEYHIKKHKKTLGRLTQKLNERHFQSYDLHPFPNAELVARFLVELEVLPPLASDMSSAVKESLSSVDSLEEEKIEVVDSVRLAAEEYRPVHFSDKFTLPLIRGAVLTREFHVKNDGKEIKYLVFDYD